MTVTLCGSPLSPYVRKAIVAFEEKAIQYKLDPQNPFPKTPELLTKTPLGKVPYLEVNGTYVPDSSAICAWAEKVKPSPSLYPEDPTDYGRALWFEEYADTALTTNAGGVFFQRVVKPNFFQEETDHALVTQILEEGLPPVLDYLNAAIGENEFIVGELFSIADIAIASPIINFRMAGEEIDSNKWPALFGYVNRMIERPSFASALANLPKPS